MAERRSAIVTGGASGIGKACVEGLAAKGWALTIADVDQRGEEIAAAIRAAGGEAQFVPTDVSDESNVRALVERATVTSCPYKGNARYWSVVVDGTTHEDVAWGYDFPLPESIRIAGLIAFYSERVDLYVDGELQERPTR